MKVLVATGHTNGWLPDDFSYCVEGELVRIDDPCDTDLRDPVGGRCGCGRAFSGLASHRATTTARVAELPMTEAEVREAIRSSLEADGWLDPSCCPGDLGGQLLEEACERVRQVVGRFEAGTVLGRRVDRIYVRGRAQVGR